MSFFGTREATLEAVAALCGEYSAPRVLDVGCGGGELLSSLAGAITCGVGIDVSASALECARRRAAPWPHLEFRLAAAETLPAAVGHRTFDVIVLAGSLEHMHDARRALAGIRGCMHAESRVLAATISPRAPHAVLSRWWLRRSAQPVVAHLGSDGLTSLAAHAGLSLERVLPLYRGLRRGSAARAARSLLSLYDRIGGPTAAVVLRRAAAGG